MSTLHLMKAVRVKMNLCKYISEFSGVNYFVLILHVSVCTQCPQRISPVLSVTEPPDPGV